MRLFYAFIVNGVRETILFSTGLTPPSGHKTYNYSTIILLKKLNKSVSSHITIYLEVDDRKSVDFLEKMISLTCQLMKI